MADEDDDVEKKRLDFQRNPSYETRAVAFYDFLGWRNKIAEAGNDPKRIGDLRRMILRNTRSLGGILQYASPGIRFSSFSDNIVVSCEVERDAILHLIATLASFQMASLGAGFLVRGGLTIGPIYHDSVSVFGPALNRAYELESQIAQVPRIVVDDNIFDIVDRHIVLISCEDVFFINPFSLGFMSILGDIEDVEERPDIYSSLGLSRGGRFSLKKMSADQFFGFPLTGIKPMLKIPTTDKEWTKIAWVYDRLASLLGMPPASSYPRVRRPE